MTSAGPLLFSSAVALNLREPGPSARIQATPDTRITNYD